MKPRLGRTVYCVYDNSILAEPVYAIGKDTFLLCPYCRDEDAIEWCYDNYGFNWFTSLAKAKKKLLETYKELYPSDKYKIVKLDDDYYELR